MLLTTLGCMYLSELVFLFFSDIYPAVELLGHMVVLFLFLMRNLHTVFHIQHCYFLALPVKKRYIFEVSFKSCSIPSIPFFSLHFFCGRTQEFLICRVPQASILVVQFSVSFCLLYFLHPGSCFQRLDQTLVQSLWQGDDVFHQEAHNMWFSLFHVNTQWCSMSRPATSPRAAKWCRSHSIILFLY